MSHVRQQIREAVALLLSGLPTTGARVFQSRIYPLRDADLPCLVVTTDSEQIEALDVSSGSAQERTLSLSIRVVAKQTGDLDDLLDSALAEVETALAEQTLGNRAKRILLQGIDVELSDDLEKPVGVATAIFSVTYYTATGFPGSAL